MTKLALIPPTPHLDLGNTTVHMMLAHLCDDPEYVKHYRHQKLIGDFLILDNSAYEFGESQVNMAALLAHGYYLQVDELVAPDVIMDERGTFAKTLDSIAFMESVVGQMAWKRAGQPRIMVCPQVDPEHQSIDSYHRHATLLMEMWHYQTPYLSGHITLGVTKNMNKLLGGWRSLFREVVSDLGINYPIQVHALGMPKSLVTVKKVLKDNPFIRSIDTALPFVCATQHMKMQVPDGALPSRPEGYLDRKFTPEEVALAIENIQFTHKYFELA